MGRGDYDSCLHDVRIACVTEAKQELISLEEGRNRLTQRRRDEDQFGATHD